MKALLYASLGMLVSLQMACVSGGSGGPVVAQATPESKVPVKELNTPEVAVLPYRDSVLIAWKPISDADGYFVYRETEDTKALLGIGPKGAQGFVDRDPPEQQAKYTVQAFKVSAPSETQATKGSPTTMPSNLSVKQRARSLQVAAAR
jgi:hypothetical protein